MIHEDEDAEPFPSSHRQPSRNVADSDAVTMGLELQAARHAKSTLLGSFRDQAVNISFDFQFADTPGRQPQPQTTQGTPTFRIPETPKSLYHNASKHLTEATNRAEEAEVALTALDIEITNLGFGDADKDDTMAMVTAIADHFRSARIELERLIPGETSTGFDNRSVLPEILKKTKLLSNKLQAKEHELKSSKDQHHNLKNNFEKAIIAAERANERIKQLESTLDNTTEETLHMRMRSQQLERDLSEKEKDVTSLSNALNKYRSDISRLETLITTLQQDCASTHTATSSHKLEELEARIAAETTGRRAAEISAVQRLQRINELETSLSTSKRHAADLESQLSTLRSSDLASSQEHTVELLNLNARIGGLATALASANAEVDKLRAVKARLEERVRSEVERGAQAVEGLQEQLIRTAMKGNEARKRYVNGAKVRIANWEIDDERDRELISSDGATVVEEGSDDGPRTPGSVVKFAEFAEVETFERDGPGAGDEEGREYVEGGELVGREDSGSGSVPGSVEVNRGRGRYRKVPRLVSYDQARRSGSGLGIGQEANSAVKRGKRRYDSGVGMESEDEFEVYEDSPGGAGEVRNGMMTPELSSDGAAEAEREMVDVMP